MFYFYETSNKGFIFMRFYNSNFIFIDVDFYYIRTAVFLVNPVAICYIEEYVATLSYLNVHT